MFVSFGDLGEKLVYFTPAQAQHLIARRRRMLSSDAARVVIETETPV
jgi:hypothetical protein